MPQTNSTSIVIYTVYITSIIHVYPKTLLSVSLLSLFTATHTDTLYKLTREKVYIDFRCLLLVYTTINLYRQVLKRTSVLIFFSPEINVGVTKKVHIINERISVLSPRRSLKGNPLLRSATII